MPTVAEPPGRLRKEPARKGGRPMFDRRNTNGQRGRVSGASVLANTKPKSHWRHPVEPSGTKRTLTRGDPPAERPGEVSRGHSSEDARRKSGGAKGRRTRGSRAKFWSDHKRTDEAAEHDNCGRDSGLTKRGPNDEVAQPERVSGVVCTRTAFREEAPDRVRPIRCRNSGGFRNRSRLQPFSILPHSYNPRRAPPNPPRGIRTTFYGARKISGHWSARQASL